MVVAAGLDVLLNPRIHAVVVRQCIEIIHHNDSILHILLEQLTQITRPRIHAQDPQHTRVVGELHQRRPARQHQHDPLPVLQQPVGGEVQRRGPPRTPRTGHEEGVTDILQGHRQQTQIITTHREGDLTRLQCGLKLERLLGRDRHRQLIHVPRTQSAINDTPRGRCLLSRLVNRRHLRRAGRIIGQHHQLDLTGPLPRAEGPPLRHGQRNIPSTHSDEVEVVRARHTQHQTILQHHPEPPPKHSPVPGDDHAQAHRRALTHQRLHHPRDRTGVGVLKGRHEVVPPVNEQHQVRQALRRLSSSPLLSHRRITVRGQVLLTVGHLATQQRQHATNPVRLVTRDHRPEVRQTHARGQGPITRVNTVDVHLSGGGRLRQGHSDPPQHAGTPRARGTGDPQVASTRVVPRHGPLRLLARQVLQAQRQRRQEAGRPRIRPTQAAPVPGGLGRLHALLNLRQRDELRQRRQPRAVRVRPPRGRVRRPHRGDQGGQISGDRRVLLHVRRFHLRAGELIQSQRRRPHRRLRQRPTGPSPHPGGLELAQARVPQPRVGAPRDRRRDVGRVRGLDDVLGVVLISDTQRDAQVRVRLDLSRDHTRRPLGRQHQVHPQRAPTPGDVHQTRHEVRQLRHQSRELVNDDHEPRHGLITGLHGGHVVLNVLRVRPRQLVLAAAQLGPQGLQGSRGEVPVQVRHHSHRVRQARTVLEGRATLVVHQHERHRIRRVAHAQGGDERLQQLGLTRTGRPGHQGVRPVSAHIQPEVPLGVLTDDRLRRPAAPVPGRQHRLRIRIRHRQDVQEP